jgi:hypothetical protein
LQRQLLSHRNEAHHLLHAGREPKRRGWCKIAKSDVGQKRPLRKIDSKGHVKHGTRRIDVESTHDACLNTGHFVAQ